MPPHFPWPKNRVPRDKDLWDVAWHDVMGQTDDTHHHNWGTIRRKYELAYQHKHGPVGNPADCYTQRSGGKYEESTPVTARQILMLFE